MSKSYAERLEKYIQTEAMTHALYSHLASLFHQDMGRTLQAMAADEARHLRAMQMEYYLLTGDSLAGVTAPKFDAPPAELLRMAYSGEWDSSGDYASEAGLQQDEKLKKLYLSQSRDELRHRAAVKTMLGRITGMGR